MIPVSLDMVIIIAPDQRWLTIGHGQQGDLIMVKCSEGTLGIQTRYLKVTRFTSGSGPLLMPYDLGEWRYPTATRDGFLHVEVGIHPWMEDSMLLGEDLVTTPQDIAKWVRMKLPLADGLVRYDQVSPKWIFA